MNSYVSAEQPLMGEVFNFLCTADIGKWRRTSKNTEYTDLYTGGWRAYVLRTGNAHECRHCSRLRGPKGMFYCSDCNRHICDNHVFSCNLCLKDMCINCIENGCLHCFR